MPACRTLSHLGRITSLTELDLSRTFCEEGIDFDLLLVHLQPLQLLQSLNLSFTGVSSQGLQAIGHLKASSH